MPTAARAETAQPVLRILAAMLRFFVTPNSLDAFRHCGVLECIREKPGRVQAMLHKQGMAGLDHDRWTAHINIVTGKVRVVPDDAVGYESRFV